MVKRILIALALVTALAAQMVTKDQAIKANWTALSATGQTAAFDAGLATPDRHTLVFVTTGSPTGCAVQLEGSVDGTNWHNLSGTQDCTTTGAVHVVNKPITQVRANLTTLSGGTSPTVTVYYVGTR